MDENMKKGTTTLGLVCKDGVVMATERRATMGHMIAHKKTQKLFQIGNNMCLTIAGLVGDGQILARYLSSEVELYQLKREKAMTVEASATMLSNILISRRWMPYWVGLLLGGVDSKGGHVYSLDAAGGSIEDKFATTGSGSPFVYGVLEDHYKEDMTVSQGVELAVLCLMVSSSRDSASGDGINVAVITEKDGFKEVSDDEIEKKMSKINKEKGIKKL